jgi:DNA-binding response OmpR family regulator
MGSRILVVDDEPLILSSIRRALNRVGYDVVTASNRDEFISALREGGYALVIMDLHLDDLSRDEIMEMALNAENSVRFLVISGSDQVHDMPYIQKPFRIVELRDRVTEILNEHS